MDTYIRYIDALCAVFGILNLQAFSYLMSFLLNALEFQVQSYLQWQTCLIFCNNLYQITMKQLLLMNIKVLQVHVTNLAFPLCSDENPIGPSSIFMRCGWITLHAWFVDCCLSKGSGGINFTNQHSLLCTLKDTMHRVYKSWITFTLCKANKYGLSLL